ncbi:restriction endonuclease subunit S [Nocardia wallacei]|uniref:restriction endonuclease subunit S n=1 Tax=Nocardia wallacei TaxID=480035 RepID=UPI0024573294|nr:restriction endonuclease subunit S [Nocardia wallacei]
MGSDVKSAKAVFHKGDVLYGKLRPYLNKVTVAPFDGIASTDILVFPESSEVLSEYLVRIMNSVWFVEHAHHGSLGVQLPRTSWAAIKDVKIPVPPVSEQGRIVQLLDGIEQGRDEVAMGLKRVRHLLTVFRKAALADAVSGRLTEGWRKENGQGQWAFLPAREVCEKVQSGGTPKAGFIDEPGIPFLKVYNIVDQRVDFHHRPQYVSKEVHEGPIRKSIALPGDVVMNIVGPPLGKVAIISDDFPEWNLNQAIVIFRPGPKILTEWLYFYLCSGVFLEDENLVTRGSAGQSNISLTQSRDLEIPVPTIDEQKEIIGRLGVLLEGGREILTKVDHASSILERAGQAALAKAVSGELTEAR